MGGFESKDGLCSCGDGGISSSRRGRRGSINVESRSDLDREGPDYLDYTGAGTSAAPPVVLMVPTKISRDGESVIDEEALNLMVSKYNESMKRTKASSSQVSERSMSTHSDITVSTISAHIPAYEASVAAAEDVDDALSFLGSLETGGASAAVAALEASSMLGVTSTVPGEAGDRISSGTPTSDDDAFEAFMAKRNQEYLQRVSTPPRGSEALGLPMGAGQMRSHSQPALFGSGGKALEVLMGIESSADESSTGGAGITTDGGVTVSDGSHSVGTTMSERSMTMPAGTMRPVQTRTPVMDSSGQYGFPQGFTHTATPKQGVTFEDTPVPPGDGAKTAGGGAGSPASVRSSESLLNTAPPLPTKTRSTASLDFSQQRIGQSQSITTAAAVRRVGSDPAAFEPQTIDRSMSFTPGVSRRSSEPRKSVFKPSDLSSGISVRKWTTKKFKKEEFAMAEALAMMGGGKMPLTNDSEEESSSEDDSESDDSEEDSDYSDETDSEEDAAAKEIEAMRRAIAAAGGLDLSNQKSEKSGKKKKGRRKSRVKRQRSTIVKSDVEMESDFVPRKKRRAKSVSDSDGAVSEEEDYEYE